MKYVRYIHAMYMIYVLYMAYSYCEKIMIHTFTKLVITCESKHIIQLVYIFNIYIALIY